MCTYFLISHWVFPHSFEQCFYSFLYNFAKEMHWILGLNSLGNISNCNISLGMAVQCFTVNGPRFDSLTGHVCVEFTCSPHTCIDFLWVLLSPSPLKTCNRAGWKWVCLWVWVRDDKWKYNLMCRDACLFINMQSTNQITL